ncbi:AAA family ATPase [Methanobrevibacter oralis]|uniref:AAA family ATPase n=1 Tax=Methanobrevibacter oralis TaxID=66851 RepID=UPI001C72F4C6|nr:AAA family ATPase [Methanobrevibacter oralis]
MAKKGLGKGLDSLIPDFYDEDFDSNSTKSLEDILNEDSTGENQVDSTSEIDIEEKVSVDENKSEEVVNKDDQIEDIVEKNDEIENLQDNSEDNEDISQIDEDKSIIDNEEVVNNEDFGVGEEEKQEEISDNDSPKENIEGERTSEDISSDKNNENSLSDTQDFKIEENVAEVKEVVEKNPRITLWSSRSAAVFRYLRKTEPEFSISKEASILIDEAVSKKYPKIWDLFDD